jgi:hypothetical protein
MISFVTRCCLILLFPGLLMKAGAQNRTLMEFYSEVPAVSDHVVDLKTLMSSGVQIVDNGWKISPGQQVTIEFPYIPPNTAITELRLGFAWEGQTATGIFEGWVSDKFRYRVFEEFVFPHETQKRIFPSMLARGYEFNIKCKMSFRADKHSLILQSLVIYWESLGEDD